MDKTRLLIFASVVAAAMVFGGVLGATAARATLLPAGAALLAAASTPSPSFKSNETPSHEAAESAAQEQAESNGTFHPGFAGGHPCGGHSNEDATHEKSETPAQEGAENAACPALPPTPATSG